MAPKTTTAAATSTRAASPASTPAAPVAANAAKAGKTTLSADSAQSTAQASPMGNSGDDVAKRAYLIYLEEGCPSGRHLDHWLRAEAELRAH